MNASEIKKALAYWLVMHRYMIVCSEFHSMETGGGDYPWTADIIAMEEQIGFVREIEIKTSLQDFKRDFKKRKHQVFQGMKKWEMDTYLLPNYFFFCAPEPLAQEIKDWIIASKYDYPGVYAYCPDEVRGAAKFKVIRQAKKLYNEVNQKWYRRIAMRLSRELWVNGKENEDD